MSLKVDDILEHFDNDQKEQKAANKDAPNKDVPFESQSLQRAESPPVDEPPKKSATTTNSPRRAGSPRTKRVTTIEKSKSTSAPPARSPEKRPPPASGIPKRLPKPAPPAVKPTVVRNSSYRVVAHQNASGIPTTISKNKLEVQFLNNRKRLLKLHAELQEKQRPLMEVHKSLLRTQQQLEGLGKKVVLEELKVVTLVGEQMEKRDISEPVRLVVGEVRSAIDCVVENCVKVCEKCFKQCDNFNGLFESCARNDRNLGEVLQREVGDMMMAKARMEKSVESSINENEKLINGLLEKIQNIPINNELSEDVKTKIGELEATVSKQQKMISDSEDNFISLNRKFEDKKATVEKQTVEYQEKITKLEEEIKKEHKTANDNLMKSRSLRTKVQELEAKGKEAEERHNEALNKLKKTEEQMRKKEVQWLKEKDDFKKNEALLQQKFAEKQSIFDTSVDRLTREMESTAHQFTNSNRSLETDLEIKNQKIDEIEKDRDYLADRVRSLEEREQQVQYEMSNREKVYEAMNMRQMELEEKLACEEEQDAEKFMEYQGKIVESQKACKQQMDEISRLHDSLKAHAQLTVSLKLDKDKLNKYNEKLKSILAEAREEIGEKDGRISHLRDRLTSTEHALKRLKRRIKEAESMDYEEGSMDEHQHHPHCQFYSHVGDF